MLRERMNERDKVNVRKENVNIVTRGCEKER